MRVRNFGLILLAGALLVTSCRKEPVKELPPPEKPEQKAHMGPAAIFIGDSITWQWGLVTRKTGTTDKLVIPFNPAPDWMIISDNNVVVTWHAGFFTLNDYVNEGVSAEKTSQMVNRFQEDVLSQDPRCVVIMGGTNDLAYGLTQDQIMANLKDMAERAAALNMKVVLCSVTPCNMPYSRLTPQEKGTHILALNQSIREYADGKGFAYCDYHQVLVADDGLSLKDEYCLYDKLHPNPDAYTAMEGVIKPIIDSVLSNNN